MSRDPELAHRITQALDAERQLADRAADGVWAVAAQQQLVVARERTDGLVEQVR